MGSPSPKTSSQFPPDSTCGLRGMRTSQEYNTSMKLISGSSVVLFTLLMSCLKLWSVFCSRTNQITLGQVLPKTHIQRSSSVASVELGLVFALVAFEGGRVTDVLRQSSPFLSLLQEPARSSPLWGCLSTQELRSARGGHALQQCHLAGDKLFPSQH